MVSALSFHHCCHSYCCVSHARMPYVKRQHGFIYSLIYCCIYDVCIRREYGRLALCKWPSIGGWRMGADFFSWLCVPSHHCHCFLVYCFDLWPPKRYRSFAVVLLGRESPMPKVYKFTFKAAHCIPYTISALYIMMVSHIFYWSNLNRPPAYLDDDSGTYAPTSHESGPCIFGEIIL